MPLGKYYCDYCEKQFQDTPAARKRHLDGAQHHRARALWYDAVRRQGCPPLLLLLLPFALLAPTPSDPSPPSRRASRRRRRRSSPPPPARRRCHRRLPTLRPYGVYLRFCRSYYICYYSTRMTNISAIDPIFWCFFRGRASLGIHVDTSTRSHLLLIQDQLLLVTVLLVLCFVFIFLSKF